MGAFASTVSGMVPLDGAQAGVVVILILSFVSLVSDQPSASSGARLTSGLQLFHLPHSVR
jgi:hypothetical protein